MPHRQIPILLTAATFLVALSASAADFWLAKDWHQWSLQECNRLLSDSPWVHIWKVPPVPLKPLPTPAPEVTPVFPPEPLDMASQPDRTEAGYHVQLNSARPVREAMARRLQLNWNHIKMPDAERTGLDLQTAEILNSDDESQIHIHVHFSGDDGIAHPERSDIPDFIRPGREYLHATLVTDDGVQIMPVRVEMDPKTRYTVDVFFPRITNGAPTIKPGQKHFTFEFNAPESINREHVLGLIRHITVKFDLTKMVVGGKRIY